MGDLLARWVLRSVVRGLRLWPLTKGYPGMPVPPPCRCRICLRDL